MMYSMSETPEIVMSDDWQIDPESEAMLFSWTAPSKTKPY